MHITKPNHRQTQLFLTSQGFCYQCLHTHKQGLCYFSPCVHSKFKSAKNNYFFLCDFTYQLKCHVSEKISLSSSFSPECVVYRRHLLICNIGPYLLPLSSHCVYQLEWSYLSIAWLQIYQYLRFYHHIHTRVSFSCANSAFPPHLLHSGHIDSSLSQRLYHFICSIREWIYIPNAKDYGRPSSLSPSKSWHCAFTPCAAVGLGFPTLFFM